MTLERLVPYVLSPALGSGSPNMNVDHSRTEVILAKLEHASAVLENPGKDETILQFGLPLVRSPRVENGVVHVKQYLYHLY